MFEDIAKEISGSFPDIMKKIMEYLKDPFILYLFFMIVILIVVVKKMLDHAKED